MKPSSRLKAQANIAKHSSFIEKYRIQADEGRDQRKRDQHGIDDDLRAHRSMLLAEQAGGTPDQHHAP